SPEEVGLAARPRLMADIARLTAQLVNRRQFLQRSVAFGSALAGAGLAYAAHDSQSGPRGHAALDEELWESNLRTPSTVDARHLDSFEVLTARHMERYHRVSPSSL